MIVSQGPTTTPNTHFMNADITDGVRTCQPTQFTHSMGIEYFNRRLYKLCLIGRLLSNSSIP